MPRALRNGAWAVVVLLVIAVSLELTVRIDDWAQFKVPLTAPEITLGELTERDSLGVHARSGAVYRQFRINSLGVRGGELSLADLTKSVVIVTSGASETFGLYETGNGQWPRQFEDSLRPRCEQTAHVLNAAFAGMTLPTVRQDIRRRLVKFRPMALVYYPTPAQYMEAELPTAAPPATTPQPPLSRWRSRALPRFRDAVKRATPQVLLNQLRILDTQRSRRAAGAGARETVEADRLEAYDRELRGLVGDLRAIGTVPVLMVHRHRFRDTTSVEDQRLLRAWERFTPLYSGRAILVFDDSAAARTRRIGRDSSITILDPLSPLLPLGASAFADFSHFTNAGAAAVGGHVASRMAPLVCGRRAALEPDPH